VRLRKRRTIATFALVPVAALLAACGGGGSSAEDSGDTPTLTLVTWGGTTEEGFKKAFADPFTEETGVPTKLVNPVDYGKYTAQIEADKVTWDWVDLEGWYVMQNQDYWAPIDREVVQYDDSDVIELPGQETVNPEWGLPSGGYSFAIAYRTDVEGPHPATWEEFFDTATFPGKRAVYNWPYGMLEVALIADGVPFEKLYPLDIDRALAKLDSVKDDLVFWNSGAELQQMMTSGETPYAFSWHNRITTLAREGQPVAIEWGENLQDAGYDVVAKNNPNLDETMQLFNLMMKPEAQAEMALATGYSPALKSAFDLIPEEEQPTFNVYDKNLEQAVGIVNHQWWADNFDEATTKWSEWAGQ
jgi:putative spermidine/putrescine transport system substrate-binding protein